jgi:hypothetical protein
VPYARAASGDGYIEVEWWYPTGDYADVIIAAGTNRFPVLRLDVDADGNADFYVEHGVEVYRGTDEWSVQINCSNGSSRFVNIWVVNGQLMSDPVSVSSTATQGARGLSTLAAQPGTLPEVNRALPRVQRVRAAAGDGFVDLEWDVPAGGIDGVIIAAGNRRHPQLRLQEDQNGDQQLTIADGTELFRGTDRYSGRLRLSNGDARFFSIWTYKDLEVSRPLSAESRAVRGGRGITAQDSLYGEEPEDFQGQAATGGTGGTGLTLQQLLDLLDQLNKN